MTKKRTVAIVHFNTPELTEALIASIRRHGGRDYSIVILDNSNERPFTAKLKGVRVLDNTKGQLIDIEKELERFPDRQEHVWKSSKFASAKHMMSVQWLIDNLDTDFMLMDSDILIKKPIDKLFDDRYSAVGKIQDHQWGYTFEHRRLLPMLCYLNAPQLKKYGAKYFDDKRTFGLLKERNCPENWYDTGAVLLEDIKRIKPHLVALIYPSLADYYVHFEHGSWRETQRGLHTEWLEKHRDLWRSVEEETQGLKGSAVVAIGRRENRYAVEFVEHYLRLGFDKIIIADNNFGNEEHFEEVLGKYIAQGKVIIENMRDRRGSQMPGYGELYAKYGKQFRWLAFFDFDELLKLPRGMKIPRFLKDFSDVDVVLVNWQVMTDNNLVTDDGRPSLKRFTKPVADDLIRSDGAKFNEHVKCIVRGNIEGLTFTNNPHAPAKPEGLTCVNTLNEIVKQSPFTPVRDNQVRLRHFVTRTIEEFVNTKSVRLFPNGGNFNELWLKTAMQDFWTINGKTEEKEKWLENHAQK